MQALNAQTVQQFIDYTQEEGFNFEIVVNKTFTTAGDGLWSNVVKDVFVESISMFISTVNDEGDFYDGDLAINYTEATWNNAKDGLIYTDRAFIAQVHAFLINAGFDNEAVNSISYSEQGMQEDERVSCDANEFADYLRNISNAKITIVE